MDRLIDELIQLADDLDRFADISRGQANKMKSQYHVGACASRAGAYERSADWIREIIERYTDEVH